MLRLPIHIDHFREIHEIVLSNNWHKRNMETLMRMFYYKDIGEPSQIEELKSREFKIYAQNGEDGLLLYIFSKIGVKNGKFVDFGCGGSSNTANLVLNFGWCGVYIDGNAKKVQETSQFFESKIGADTKELSIIQSWITKENINQIIREVGLTGEIDLLSIDMDGNDYWIWEAIDVIQPMVVLIEYNASLGPQRSLSVAYDPNFDVGEKHPSRWYHGASLTALTKLGHQKSYTLIGCESNGVNAFFIRDELIHGNFHGITPSEAFYPHFQRPQTYEEQFETIKDLEFVKV